MQRLFEIVTLEEEKQIFFENIKNDIVNMALHPKGNFVLLATFSVLDKTQIEFIIMHLLVCFHELIFTKEGVCIANMMIEKS